MTNVTGDELRRISRPMSENDLADKERRYPADDHIVFYFDVDE